MKTKYVLIDYENVQPTQQDLARLKKQGFSVYVFVGASQKGTFKKLSQEDLELIQISGNGKNALDFHIAMYLGKLSEKDPDATYFVISKDKGFNPLIDHFNKTLKVKVQRNPKLAANLTPTKKNITSVNVKKTTAKKSTPNKNTLGERVQTVRRKLKSLKEKLPARKKTLWNTIQSLFDPQPTEKELTAIIEKLQKNGWIVLENTKVTYKPPISQT